MFEVKNIIDRSPVNYFEDDYSIAGIDKGEFIWLCESLNGWVPSEGVDIWKSVSQNVLDYTMLHRQWDLDNYLALIYEVLALSGHERRVLLFHVFQFWSRSDVNVDELSVSQEENNG